MEESFQQNIDDIVDQDYNHLNDEDLKVRKKRRVFPFDDYDDQYGVWRKKRQISNDIDDFDDELGDIRDYQSCPAGTVYCLEMNQCSPDCGGNKLDRLELEDEDDGNEDDDEEDDGGDYITCPPGTTFCLSEMRCAANCGMGGMDDDFDELFGDEEDDDDDGGVVCPAGQVFCMQVMACVSNCGFFEEESHQEGVDTSDGEEGVTCPDSQVYCMARDTCVPHNSPCEQDTGRPRPELHHARCPASEFIVSVGQSLCQVASHCPANTSCCHDSMGYKQCVTSGTNDSLPSTSVLATGVCDTVPQDLVTIAGSDCSLDPGQCGRGAICCDGVCHGLPSLNQTLTSDCPPGLM